MVISCKFTQKNGNEQKKIPKKHECELAAAEIKRLRVIPKYKKPDDVGLLRVAEAGLEHATSRL